MNKRYPKLAKPPIVEAIVDFDCDVPPNKGLGSLESAARDVFRDRYPDAQPRYLQEVRVATGQDDAFNSSLRRSLQAWMFRTQQKDQLVQVRQSGFSFNRLAPYDGFDACLPEIERTWRQYLKLAEPIVLREIRLRYINRIPLPLDEVEKRGLEYFLTVGAAPPAEAGLVRSGFLMQYQASDPDMHLRAAVVLASQAPETGILPVMFDITALSDGERDPSDWGQLISVLESLRDLKDRIFFRTVKPPCLELFQ